MRLREIREWAELVLTKSAIGCVGIAAALCVELMSGGWFDWQALGVHPNPLAFLASGIVCLSAAMFVSPEL